MRRKRGRDGAKAPANSAPPAGRGVSRWRGGATLSLLGFTLLVTAWVAFDRLAASHAGLAIDPDAPAARTPIDRLRRLRGLLSSRPPALSRADRDPALPVPAAGAGPGPHAARYGGRSGRLPSGLTVAAAEPTTRIDSTEQNPGLQVWVPSVRVTARGTTIHARIIDDPATPAVLSPPLVAVAPADEAPADFVPMQISRAAGSAADPHDARAFERAFVPPAAAATAAPSPPGARGVAPPRQFRYQVVVRGTRAGAPFERRAGGLFFVHDPRATLDAAHATVTPEGGDLVLRAPIAVERAGTYYVYAELWGGADGNGQQAIAFARDRLVGVAAGPRTIELRFGGAIIADAHVDGPYVVRNLRLQQVDTHPAHEADPVRALPATPAWPSSRFH
jgi:hypothetical protein